MERESGLSLAMQALCVQKYEEKDSIAAIFLILQFFANHTCQCLYILSHEMRYNNSSVHTEKLPL